jgi:prepilin-type N-terminal cleavage/methylation domain-containing protein
MRQPIKPLRRLHKTLHKAQAGFTLIEILVVVSLSVIVSVAAAGLFFTTLITNTKKEILSLVKDEGDYAMNQMEFLLRNAVELVRDPSDLTGSAPICTAGMQQISFRSLDEGITTFYNTGGRVASKSASSATPLYLTSDAVTLTGPTFDCEQSSDNYGSYVTISFTLQKDSPDANRPQPVKEDFTTSVNVRNF